MFKIAKEKEHLADHRETGYVILFSLILALLGLLLLLVPQIQLTYIVYALSIAIIVVGIFLIVRYFLTESYRNMSRYGFSVGVLFVILGICAMLRAQVLAEYLVLCLGVFILIMGIIQLQNAVDLNYLKNKYWLILLALALLALIFSVVILINPFKESIEIFTYISLIIEGLISLISMFCLSVSIRKFEANAAVAKYETIEVVTEELEVNEESI